MQKKSKNKRNKKNLFEEDTILRKKTKKNEKNEINIIKATTNEPNIENEEIFTPPLISEYEKFLRKYKINKANFTEKSYISNVKKLPHNEIQQSKLPRIKFVQKSNYKGYSRHFEEDYKKFSNKIIEEGIKAVNSKTSSEFMEGFAFTTTEDKGENIKNKSDNDVLNNNIKIRNYVMRKEFKRNKVEFCSNYFEKIIADKNAQEFIDKEGLQKDPPLHKKISHLPTQEEWDQEDHELFTFLNEYLDFVYVGNEENEFLKFRKIWIAHILNHILNGNDEFNSNKNEIENEDENENNETIKKNKGFTRCKILILCPYKRDGYEIIMDLIEYFSKGTLKKSSHKTRFMQEFGLEDSETQDNFKFGLSFANKNINLYTPFVKSDIIIASPLGLRLLTGAKGDENREFSFLSSIEILVIDQANILYMQNWQHMEEILQIMNKTPKYKDMTNSLDEIRELHFENLSKFYRQSIVSTQHNFPELNSINIRFFNNYKGCLQNKLNYLPIVLESFNNFSVEFMKIEVNSYEEDSIQRFEYFKNKIWLKINDRQDMFKTVIFVNSYYEYIKLRNYFKKSNSFVQFICEYTSKSSVQSRLSQLNKKTIPFLLFSERAYFFKICELKNICNIIFYSLPKNDFIYKNMIMSLRDPQMNEKDENKGPSFKNKVKCIFSKYDAMFLEKIVGTEALKEFLAEYNKASTFIV